MRFCGDGTCRARAAVLLLLPDDPGVARPCGRCEAAAADAAGDLARATRSAGAHFLGPW